MKKTIDFYGKRNIFFILSAAVIVIGIVINLFVGTRLDIQFAGGAVIKYNFAADIASNEIEKIVEDVSGRNATVQINEAYGTSDGQKQATVSFAGNESLTLEEQTAIADALDEAFAETPFTVAESSSVDPMMGATFFEKCMICVAITFVLLLIYIAIRFRKIGGFSAGVCALIALAHDVLISYLVFVIFGFAINDSFIAVILTILGYSLNDTIVLYDRIRENRRLLGNKTDYPTLVNLSLNQTLFRSVATSVTTFVAICCVFVVALIYQLNSVMTFALPMMVGVVVGCYSSLFIAGPLFAMWQNHKHPVVSEK